MIEAIRFRAEGTLLVLQVCESEKIYQMSAYSNEPRWRDANIEDLLQVARFTRDNRDKLWATGEA